MSNTDNDTQELIDAGVAMGVEAARLRAENEALKAYSRGLNDILAFYRLGRHPTEKKLREFRAAEDRLTEMGVTNWMR